MALLCLFSSLCASGRVLQALHLQARTQRQGEQVSREESTLAGARAFVAPVGMRPP